MSSSIMTTPTNSANTPPLSSTSSLQKSFHNLSIFTSEEQKSADNNNGNATTTNNDILGFTQGLLTYFQESQSRLDKWANEQKELADNARMEESELWKRERKDVDDLMGRYKNIQARRGMEAFHHDDEDGDRYAGCDNSDNGQARESIALDMDIVKEKRLVTEMLLKKFQNEQSELQQDMGILKEEEKIECEKAQKVRQQKQRIEEARKVSVEDLTYAVFKYKMTGLDFIKGENQSIRCKFTKVDPNNHDRAFMFTLRISQSDQYVVEGCEPQLEEHVLDRLLIVLNSTADGMEEFPGFIRGMRKAFKNHLLTE